MGVSVNCGFRLDVRETFTPASAPAASQAVNTITHSAFDRNKNLDAASTPAATGMSAHEIALVAGAAAIDLTSLPQTGGGTWSATGKKLRALLFTNQSATNSMTLGPGASNAYDLFGTGNEVVVPPSGTVQMYFADGAPAVGSGAKALAVAGTGTDTAQLLMVFG